MTIDERIATELRRHAPQLDEPLAWERIQATAARRRQRRLWQVPVAAAALGVLLGGLILVQRPPSVPGPVGVVESAFRGTWVTRDADGSTPMMTVEVLGDGTVEVAALDGNASVCSGAPSTMTGSGRLEGETVVVIPTPVLTCDDGSDPQALSGPPLEEQLADLTFNHDPGSDTLTDNLGSVWAREGAEDPSPDPTVVSGMWPQSNLEEAQEAQDLADAGDPSVTWQVEPALDLNLLTAAGDVGSADIVVRFLREELGWDEFRYSDHHGGASDGTVTFAYIRCAPGEINSLYPDDPNGASCAPTIDDFTFETVGVTVGQPVRRGSAGIWVVTQWANLEPFKQATPPTDGEATTFLEAFLQARIEGEGAEQYFGGGDGTAPLLYATSTEKPYERYEHDLVARPLWPNDPMRFDIQLYAEDGQILVQQTFRVERDENGSLGLGFEGETFENGQPLAHQYHDILGGEVSFYSGSPWEGSLTGSNFGSNDAKLYLDDGAGSLLVLADPLPVSGCAEGPVPADATALAQSILSNDSFEANPPEATTIGGTPALSMDLVVVMPGSPCSELPRSHLTWFEVGDRVRLYLVDLPEGSSANILAITIGSREALFESVVESAAPIVDSFEFHTG